MIEILQQPDQTDEGYQFERTKVQNYLQKSTNSPKKDEMAFINH